MSPLWIERSPGLQKLCLYLQLSVKFSFTFALGPAEEQLNNIDLFFVKTLKLTIASGPYTIFLTQQW